MEACFSRPFTQCAFIAAWLALQQCFICILCLKGETERKRDKGKQALWVSNPHHCKIKRQKHRPTVTIVEGHRTLALQDMLFKRSGRKSFFAFSVPVRVEIFRNTRVRTKASDGGVAKPGKTTEKAARGANLNAKIGRLKR